MRRDLHVLLLAVGLLAGGAAVAQQVELEPSPAAQCLTASDPALALPDYPFVQYKSGERGRVKLALEFSAADAAPQITVLEHEGGEAFVDSVRVHARSLRVPCLPAGGTVRLERDYVFEPDRQQAYAGPGQDVADVQRRELLGCMRHVSGSLQLKYPYWARRAQVQGRVLVQLRFDDGASPPAVLQVSSRPGARRLAAEIEQWMAGVRLPCHAGGPIHSTLVYAFHFEGEAYGFKPMTLLQFMGNVKGARQQRVQFDTTHMGCPFDIRLLYAQPFQRNRVGSVGGYDPARHALLEWLRNAELDVPSNMLDAVFGDTADITVPCLKIDHTPKEKS
ncbi:hypothetical protein ACPOLB_13930 [Rubrivivax sp. RP6-9]|uniref:hypothetical protein n=1 Tax=Rubrivivax sp. RP6-9 TaxID=3415750 RepID=UPI003CC59596